MVEVSFFSTKAAGNSMFPNSKKDMMCTPALYIKYSKLDIQRVITSLEAAPLKH